MRSHRLRGDDATLMCFSDKSDWVAWTWQKVRPVIGLVEALCRCTSYTKGLGNVPSGMLGYMVTGWLKVCLFVTFKPFCFFLSGCQKAESKRNLESQQRCWFAKLSQPDKPDWMLDPHIHLGKSLRKVWKVKKTNFHFFYTTSKAGTSFQLVQILMCVITQMWGPMFFSSFLFWPQLNLLLKGCWLFLSYSNQL